MKNSLNEILYATSNKMKFVYAKNILTPLLPLVAITQLDEEIPEEQSFNQAGIAQAKARAAWQRFGVPVLADDGGIYFDAYPQFPGFMTKYVWRSLGVEGIFKLVDGNPRATLRLFLAFCYGPAQDQCLIFEGKTAGTLVKPATPVPPDSPKPFQYLLVPDGARAAYDFFTPEEQAQTPFARVDALRLFANWYRINRK